MITLHTSGVVALLHTRDRHHHRARDALTELQEPTVIPAPVLSEMTYVLALRLGSDATLALLEGLERGESFLDCCDADLPRVRELMVRYADVDLGFADACVVACAERNGGKIFTFDLRDFAPIAAEGLITIVP